MGTIDSSRYAACVELCIITIIIIITVVKTICQTLSALVFGHVTRRGKQKEAAVGPACHPSLFVLPTSSWELPLNCAVRRLPFDRTPHHDDGKYFGDMASSGGGVVR